VASFTLEAAVTIAARAVAQLAADAQPVLVLGESAGGLIALELARLDGVSLAGLVLADPPLAPAKLCNKLFNRRKKRCTTRIWCQ
jgi:pimeloyl-ACP methyl ester carboxylesterase